MFTANPDAKAFIGLCALDIPSLAQLQEGAPDTDYVMAGYDLTPQNVAALKEGTADVSLGQTPFMQGYLPVKMLVDTLSGATTVDLTQGGFVDAGTEVATKDGVELPHGLGTATLGRDLEAIAGDPAAARAFYQPLVDGIIADWARQPRAHRERVEVACHGDGRRYQGSLDQGPPSDAARRERRPHAAVAVRACPGPTAASGPSSRWTSTSSRARSTRSSARTAPASRRS